MAEENRINWNAILSQLVAAVVPLLIELIVKWLQDMSDEEVVAVSTKAGKAYNAFTAA